jgi:hypothetical protein
MKNPIAMPKPYGYVDCEGEITLEEYFRRLQVEEPELDSYIPEIDKPRDKQVGGKHYHKGNGIQPWDIIEAWELDFWEGNVVKYILRWKHKDGVQDLEKARHYLDYIINKATTTRE